MAAGKDPITTHCLDQTTGTPAGGIHVTLKTTTVHFTTGESTSCEWEATTSKNDGRINVWKPVTPADMSDHALSDAIASRGGTQGQDQEFRLSFRTADYWMSKGQKSFYPQVDISFTVEAKDADQGHWHVPVLLGPWGYTTYRGS